MPRPVLALATVLLLAPATAGAQGYRLRLDTRGQVATYRGLTPDSISAGRVVPSATGGLETPDGFAVRCSGGDQCYYFRPGPSRRGVPITTQASLVLWGLGIPRLTVHASGRLVADAGSADVWPGSRPRGQLIEGYLEYALPWLTGRGGRLLVASRLEPIGFDGGWARLRWGAAALEFTGYGGWALGQAAVVPITSPSLNPLDEFQPRDRQLVAGAEAAWSPGPLDLRLEYRREVDPETDHLGSERAALSLGATPWTFLRVTGGADYNVAEDLLGSADLAVTYRHSRFSVSGGARRYRPSFPLWTIWGAFSPVPYNGLTGSAEVRIADWLSLRGRGERYWYDAAEVSTGLVGDLEDRGWRVSVGAQVDPAPRWTVDGNYLVEFGPGASSRFLDGGVSYRPTEALTVGLYGGRLERPLELRFYDATTTWVGGRAEWTLPNQWRVWGDAARFDDDRDRPDAAATSFDQGRLRGGLTVGLGSRTDRMPLPPARRGQP